MEVLPLLLVRPLYYPGIYQDSLSKATPNLLRQSLPDQKIQRLAYKIFTEFFLRFLALNECSAKINYKRGSVLHSKDFCS
jgi:hypothetical protein